MAQYLRINWNGDQTVDVPTKQTLNNLQTQINSKQGTITASGILKGDGSGSISAAVAGTDYPDPEIYQDTKIVSQDSAFGIDASGIALESSGFITLRANAGSTGLLINSWNVSPNGSDALNMTLGTQDDPWQSVYSNKYLSGSNMALTFGFANGSTAFSAGYSPEALVPGVIKNLGTYENAWNNLYIKSDTPGEYYQYTSTGINCFTYKFIIDIDSNTGGIGVEFNSDTVSPLGSGPYSLGDVNNFGWESIYLNTSTSSTKGMSIKYNDDEECIEFLAE